MSSRNTKLFISGLGSGVQQKDIIDLFSRHGRVLACSLKNGYAFVEFSHPDDADDAIRVLDGYIYHGKKLLVQLAVQKGKPLSPSRDMSRNRIYVGGLTEGINMRELEEVFSEVGHVVRTVDKKSFAFLEYESPLHAEKAIKRFHHTDFAGRRLTVNFATIPFHHGRPPGPHHSPRRGRSRSVSRSLSRGRKRMRYSSLSRSRSRSTSRSPTRYSRSRSRSRDRSAWDRGRDRGRDRRRGRSRDYSPYFRSWSRSTSRSSSRSDSSSRSRSRSVSKSPTSSQSSSSPPLNSPPGRVPNHSTLNGHTPKDTSNPPSSVTEVPTTQTSSTPTATTTVPTVTSPETQPSSFESQTVKPDIFQLTTTATIASPNPSTNASPTPASPPLFSPPHQDIIMTDIKTEQPTTDSPQATFTPQEPPNKPGTISLGFNPSSVVLPTSSLLPTHPTSPAIPLQNTAPSSSTAPQSTNPAASPSTLTSSSELDQRPANFDSEKEKEKEKEKEREKDKEKEKEKEKEKDKEKENKDKDTETKERDSRDHRERDRERDRDRDRDTHRDRDYRDRERERERERDYGRRRYSDRTPYTSHHSTTQDRKPERDAAHQSTDAEDAQKEDSRVNGTSSGATNMSTDTATTASAPTTASSKDALDQVLVNLFKTRDSMLKGIDGVFGELQRRNQLFTQLISREEGRNKEIDGLRAELVNVKKDLVAKQDMGWRRLESELERRLALLERKVTSKPPSPKHLMNYYVRPPCQYSREEDAAAKGGKALMSQDSFITALTNSLAPVCASVETLYKMIGDARSEQQVLKNEMRLVLDALRADVHGSREAVLVKVDSSLGDLRAPLGQLAASEAQSARLIDGVRAQVVTLQQQVAGVAQTQQTQQSQPQQEPAPSFAGAFGKKMFPIEALTSKIFSIDQKIETLEGNLTKQFLELKNEILTQQAIKGMITEDKKNTARATRKKGSGSAVYDI